MSVVSNVSVLNGSCHSQQALASRIPPPTSLDPGGDNPTLHKGAHLSTELGAHHTLDSHSECGANGLLPEGSAEAEDDAPCIDIIINNVVCSFSTKCYLNLKKIATEGVHVEYRRENGMVNMKLRRPNVTATIWSSGNVTCTGSTSEDEARVSARRVARRLQRLGFNARFSNYRVVNVLGTCSFKFGIKLVDFSELHPMTASYEPELHPGVTYRIKEPKATLKIFSTGSITVTAPCVANVQNAIEHIYPLVLPHKTEYDRIKKLILAEKVAMKKKGMNIPYKYLRFGDDDEDEEDEEDDDIDEFDLGMGAHSLAAGRHNEESDDDFSDDFDSDESQD